jgi:DNA-binding NarL/FixJ family response regulator
VALVRILIVDDYEPWRRMVGAMLQRSSDWQIIGEASDGLGGVQKSAELQPDLILLDLGLPNLNGIEAGRQIREIAPRAKIIFLSENCCPDVISEAFRIGAAGYVVKSDAPRDLVAAVEAVIENKLFVNSRFAGGIPDRPPSPQ